MKKNKKQEKRRKKLRTLILLLFLTIIMFGTSTYAWFTANKVVTINALDVQVSASNGIQISTNAKDWKSVITKADIITGYSYNNGDLTSVNQVPTEITAVSTDMVAQTGGILNMYSSIIENAATDGSYTIRTKKETDTNGQTGKYIAFDVFLRVDTAQTVYLTSGSDVVLTNSNDEDRGLKNAARVAFVNNGNGPATTAPETLAAYNAAGEVISWEPNSDSHSAFVVSSVAPEYGVTLTETSADSGKYNAVEYRGINKEITTALSLKEVVNKTDTSATSIVNPTIKTTEENAAYNTFKASLPAGVTKYRVYMWVEGQDIDCENNATGSNISFKIELSTENPSASSASTTQP